MEQCRLTRYNNAVECRMKNDKIVIKKSKIGNQIQMIRFLDKDESEDIESCNCYVKQSFKGKLLITNLTISQKKAEQLHALLSEFLKIK
jgi:hypothetical protein